MREEMKYGDIRVDGRWLRPLIQEDVTGLPSQCYFWTSVRLISDRTSWQDLSSIAEWDWVWLGELCLTFGELNGISLRQSLDVVIFRSRSGNKSCIYDGKRSSGALSDPIICVCLQLTWVLLHRLLKDRRNQTTRLVSSEITNSH